jgi:hypothetical protein
MPLKITQPLLPDLNGMNLMVKEIWTAGSLVITKYGQAA